MNKKGLFYCILSAVLYGIAPLITKTVYSYGIHAIGLSFYRSLFSLPFWYFLAIKSHHHAVIEKPLRKNVILVGLLGSTLTTLFLNLAYSYIDMGTASTLHFMHPMFVTLMCVILFKEKLNLMKTVSLILALVGVSMFMDASSLSNSTGVLFAIISAFTYACYFLGVDKFNLRKIPTFVLSFWIAAIACCGFFVLGIITKTLFIPDSFELTLLLLLNAIVCQVLAVTLLQIGIGYLGSQSASLLSLFEPVTSVFVGILILHESFSYYKVFGCLLIFTAVFIHMKEK